MFLRVERKEGVWDVNEGRRRQKKQICHWRRRSQQKKKKSCIFLCFLRRKSAHKVPQTDTSFSNYNVFISTTSLKRIKAHPIFFFFLTDFYLFAQVCLPLSLGEKKQHSYLIVIKKPSCFFFGGEAASGQSSSFSSFANNSYIWAIKHERHYSAPVGRIAPWHSRRGKKSC